MAVKLIHDKLFIDLETKAIASDRLRINYNFHASMEDNPHRFLNVMARGTYITPHRHLDPPKDESFLVLKGSLAFCIFDDSGQLQSVYKLGDGEVYGIDVPAGTWHSLVVLSDVCVCYEVKPGPYLKATDKDFAPWAPRENEVESSPYLANLSTQVAEILKQDF